MEHHSVKHKELSGELASWWQTQTDFKTKNALAVFIKVHPVTLSGYFTGKAFPGAEVANRLYELTKINCLKSDTGSGSSLEVAPQETSTTPLHPHPSGVAASIEEPQESDIVEPSGQLQEEARSKSAVIARQIPSGLPQKGGRRGERSVVISLQRTCCPFCSHQISTLRSCGYCGQQFAWANVPLDHGQPM
jgi:hypothetical protein